MKKSIKTLFAASLLLASHSLFAADSAQKNQPDNPWTDCGIGYAIFPSSEVGAAISNVIWDAGTTATTTFISTPDSCRERNGEVAKFVGESYENLERETAVGEGEFLNAMIEVAQCDSSASEAFVSSVRDTFGAAVQQEGFSTLSRQEKAGVYFAVVESKMNGEFASACAAS